MDSLRESGRIFVMTWFVGAVATPRSTAFTASDVVDLGEYDEACQGIDVRFITPLTGLEV